MENRIYILCLAVSIALHIAFVMPFAAVKGLLTKQPEDQFIDLVYQEYEKNRLMDIAAPEEAAAQMQEEAAAAEETEMRPEPEQNEVRYEESAAKAEPPPPPAEEAKESRPAEPEKPAQPEKTPEEEAKEIEKQKEELQKKVDAIQAEDLAKTIVTYADLLREFISLNFRISLEDRLAILRELGATEASVHVFFTLMADGSMLDVFIPEQYQSRSKRFNEAAVRSIQKASKRFPKFPKNYSKDVETFEIVIRISTARDAAKAAD